MIFIINRERKYVKRVDGPIYILTMHMPLGLFAFVSKKVAVNGT